MTNHRTQIADDIAKKCGFAVSAALRDEIDFSLSAADYAPRLDGLAFVVRKGDARLALRSELVRELKASGNPELGRMVKEQTTTPTEIVFAVLHGSPRICVLSLRGLRAATREAPTRGGQCYK
jgi:hypothetical protein